MVKDPDHEIQDRITLVFASFLEQGSVAKVMRIFARGALGVPRRDRFGEAVWRPATLNRLNQILRNPAYAGTLACRGATGSVRRCGGRLRSIGSPGS